MNNTKNSVFLLEVGCEEIPSPMIDGALSQLKGAFAEKLTQSRIDFGEISIFGTPRRLALMVNDISLFQSDLDEIIIGPPASVAFKDGELTGAGKGFAAGKGIPIEKLEIIETEKGSYAGAKVRTEGKATIEVLSSIIPEILKNLTFPKTMRWGEGKHRFVRPVRNILAIIDENVVDFTFGGVKSSTTTFGHRFFGESTVVLDRPSDYVEVLQKQSVYVEKRERADRIKSLLEEKAGKVNGKPVEDEALLGLVSNLMEFPNVICGKFSEDFLGLPREILITSMREHQKYFALEDKQGELLPFFLAVVDVSEESIPSVTKGHEWVLRSRLADAVFFWNEDRKKSLTDRLESLKNVVFQKNLGSYYDKVQRISALSQKLCTLLEMDSISGNTVQAAQLCKSDLTTDLVGEFPALQGVLGGLYGKEEGLGEEVWRAVYSHYLPKSMDDDVPFFHEGAILSLADKVDSLVGCFGFNIIPSGSKDPFALRRAGQGICKIILAKKYSLKLGSILNAVLDVYAGKVEFKLSAEELREQFSLFMGERLRHLLGSEGHSYDCINAVFAAGFEDLSEAAKRVRALSAIKKEKDIESLSISFKRIKNLIGTGERLECRQELFVEEAEKELYSLSLRVIEKTESLLGKGDYLGGLKTLVELRPAIDNFFDVVMVMTEDIKVRNNRIALLSVIAGIFLKIADISEIVVNRE